MRGGGSLISWTHGNPEYTIWSCPYHSGVCPTIDLGDMTSTHGSSELHLKKMLLLFGAASVSVAVIVLAVVANVREGSCALARAKASRAERLKSLEADRTAVDLESGVSEKTA